MDDGWMDGEIEGHVDTPLERNVTVRLSTSACCLHVPSSLKDCKCSLFVVMQRTQLTESRLSSHPIVERLREGGALPSVKIKDGRGAFTPYRQLVIPS